MSMASPSNLTADKDWWRGAVIYQIYPRSFQDSNGDGIGDLKGITARLPHVANLGADAIWISPFFTSPMRDFGYDVSDYENVDSIFGTLVDFDSLIAEAHTPRHPGDDRPGHLALVRPASVVRRKPLQQDQRQVRLVCLGRFQAGWHAAQQLAVDLRRLGLGVGSDAACSITCTTS
jgi:hypothetical protein